MVYQKIERTIWMMSLVGLIAYSGWNIQRDQDWDPVAYITAVMMVLDRTKGKPQPPDR